MLQYLLFHKAKIESALESQNATCKRAVSASYILQLRICLASKGVGATAIRCFLLSSFFYHFDLKKRGGTKIQGAKNEKEMRETWEKNRRGTRVAFPRM